MESLYDLVYCLMARPGACASQGGGGTETFQGQTLDLFSQGPYSQHDPFIFFIT